MTRGEFSIALAGAAATLISSSTSRVVTLRAIAGPRLPEILTITTSSFDDLQPDLWEMRTYKGASPGLAHHLEDVFPRAGIRPLLRQTDGPDLTYLFRFENLTARERAWTALNADPAWTRLPRQFAGYRFGLYQLETGRARS